MMVVGRFDPAAGEKTFRPFHPLPDGSWAMGNPLAALAAGVCFAGGLCAGIVAVAPATGREGFADAAKRCAQQMRG